MQKWLAVAVIGMFGMVPAAVWAQSNHNNMTGTGSGVGATVQQGRNNSLNSNSATGGQGGQGIGGSSSVGGNSGINYGNTGLQNTQSQSISGSGNSRNINQNDNTNENRNTIRNSGNSSATGGRGGSAIQGQRQGQVNQPQQTIGGDSYSVESPRQAPPASAPNLVAAPETCMGSTAVGASTPFGGVSVGTPYKSNDCELRMFARSLMSLGQPEAALALLAQNDKVAAALRAVGNKSAWLKDEKDQTPAPVAAQGITPAAPRLAENTQSP